VFSFKPETIGSKRAARLCANQNADREHKKEQSRRRGEKNNKSTFLVPLKKIPECDGVRAFNPTWKRAFEHEKFIDFCFECFSPSV
tara:strand:- start:534 stop:791 length:258 start_codon:yes stop_codon:yes gene_type:complete